MEKKPKKKAASSKSFVNKLFDAKHKGVSKDDKKVMRTLEPMEVATKLKKRQKINAK